jgi:hypothetical protein
MKFTIDVRRRGALKALRALLKRIKVRMGWRYCGCCRQFVRLQWEKDWIVHPEEPPLFCHWECPNCGAGSPILPTSLTTKAVRSLGFKDFNDYAEKALAPRNKDE